MPSEKRARQRAYREQKLAAEQRRKSRAKRAKQAVGVLVVVGAVVGLVAALSGHSTTKRHVAARPATTTTSPAPATSAPSTTQAGTPVTAPVSSTPVAPTCPPSTAAGSPTRRIAFTKAPPDCIPTTGVYDATFDTNAGTFVVRMDAATSYAAVNNFVFLARYHLFDGTTFPRVIPGFIIQGGSPGDNITGGPGYQFTGNTPPASCTAKKDCYPSGSLAMANSGSPTTDGSQFFIVTSAVGGQGLSPTYTRFGQVIKGMPVVEKISAGGNPATSANGMPPKVLYHIVKVTISQVSS